MSVFEIKVLRRINLGNYEHIEVSITSGYSKDDSPNIDNEIRSMNEKILKSV